MEWIESLYFKRIALFLAALVFTISLAPSDSLAYVIGVDGASTRAADMARIQRVLESKMVGERLKRLGLKPSEVKARLTRLTDAELHSVAKKVDSLYPGGDAAGVIISLLVIAILVVILLKITNRRIIIK